MAGKAQLPKTGVDEIVKANKERKKQFGRERSLFAGIPQLLAVNGIGVSHKVTGGLIQPIQGLATAGGPMMGPIAFHPTTTGIVSGVLDIAKTTSAFSSRVIVLGQANPDNLCRIAGAAHAGQILFLQAVSTTAIVLKHLTDESPAVGNIYMPSGNDYTVAGKEIVLLQWDTINPPAGTEYGQWTLVATSGSGVGFANQTLSNLTAPTAVNVDLDPDNSGTNPHLGDATKIWEVIYGQDIHVSGDIKTEPTSDHTLNIFTGGGNRLAISDSSSNGAGYAELFGVIAGSGESQTHPSYKTVATDASPADNDMVGALGFDGYNSATERLTWARMVGVSDVVTDSAETAHFEFKALQSGTEKTLLETDQFGIYLSNDVSGGGTSPAYNGAIYRDGNDIKCYSGGGTRNLSEVGSGSWVGTATSQLDMATYSIKGGYGGTANVLGILSDLNMNTYDIINPDRIKFSTTEGSGDSLAATDTGIEAIYTGVNPYGMKIQIPTAHSAVFQIVRGSTEMLNISALGLLAGDDLSMSSNKITNLATPTSDYDASTKKYVDDSAGGSGANTALSNLSSVSVNATIDMNTNDISNVGTLEVDGTTNLDSTVNLGNGSSDDINLNGKLDVNNNYTDSGLGYAPLPVGYISITVGSTSRRLYYYAG